MDCNRWWYAVTRAHDGEVMYLGTSVNCAADSLRPGTTHGACYGPDKEQCKQLAVDRARLKGKLVMMAR